MTTSFNQMTGNVERLLSVEKEKERLQAELEIAREVQTQLYPRSAAPARCLRLTVHCEPARMVSGDYYDYENRWDPSKLAFAIGDVAGKGISAALLMATFRPLCARRLAGAVNANIDCRAPLLSRRDWFPNSTNSFTRTLLPKNMPPSFSPCTMTRPVCSPIRMPAICRPF